MYVTNTPELSDTIVLRIEGQANNPNKILEDRTVKIPHVVEPAKVQIKIPKFQLPSVVKGYTEGKLSSFAKMSLPKTEYHNYEEIQFTFKLLDPTMLGKISPLIVDVLRKDAEYQYTLFYNQQFVLQPNDNLVILIADFGVGKFILQVGFYLVDELNQEYPHLYRTQTEIVVKE